LSAPGDAVTSLGADGESLTLGGTSVAAPFVAGTVALLWSLFPDATATAMKVALTLVYPYRRATIVPPLLDAWTAYQVMTTRFRK
jgi:subtilisin family serine protease